MVARPLSHGQSTAEMVLGYSGLLTAIGVILSALPTFHGIRKNQDVGTTKPYTYIAVVCNSGIWVVFGIPVLIKLAHDEHHAITDWLSLPLTVANGAGVIFELAYVFVYLRYAGAGNRGWPLAGLAVAVVTPPVLLAFLFGLKCSRTFVGVFAMVTGAAMYAIPLYTTYEAFKTNDSNQISRLQAAASLLNGFVWAAYSCIGGMHAFVFVPNFVAIICASIQLVVWRWIKSRAPPPDTEANRRQREEREERAGDGVVGDGGDGVGAGGVGASGAGGVGAGGVGAGGGGSEHVEMTELQQKSGQDVPARVEQPAQGVEPEDEITDGEAKNDEVLLPGGVDKIDEVEDQVEQKEEASGHGHDDDNDDGGGGGIPVEDTGEDKAEDAIPE